MYDVLRNFAREQIQDWFLSEALPGLDPKSVQGIHVGIDQYWLKEWAQTALRTAWGWPLPGPPPYWGWYNGRRPSIWWLRNRLNVPLDLSFRPPDWDRYCQDHGYREDADPIYIRILLYPNTDRDQLRLEGGETRHWRNHPILFEERPPCEAISLLKSLSPTRFLGRLACGVRKNGGEDVLVPGQSIGPNRYSAGTAGGFLTVASLGQNLLVSCAHVVSRLGTNASAASTMVADYPMIYHPSPQDSWHPQPIGKVIYYKLSDPVRPDFPCSPKTVPNASPVDLAAVLVEPNVAFSPVVPKLGPLAYWAPVEKMSQTDRVTFIGRTSGHVQAQMRDLCVWRPYSANGETRCFRDLFEIVPPEPFYFNIRLAKNGDSGAWIYKVHNGSLIWYGMLLSTDGASAYGCFAEHIVDELKAHFSSMIMLS